jgi:hypothetical protein
MLEAELQQVKLELEAEKVLCLAHAVDGDKIIADQKRPLVTGTRLWQASKGL